MVARRRCNTGRARGGHGSAPFRRAAVRCRPLALPASIGALALALRVYGLGDKPFWLDEVASLRRATGNIPDLVADSLHANHYPSYFLLLWLVAKLGTSQWLLRLPSALFGALAAALTCSIGRRVADARTGAAAGLLLAFSPFEVQFGQEARSYTLVCCLILTALSGWCDWRRTRRRRRSRCTAPASCAAPGRPWARHRGGARRAQCRDTVARRRQSRGDRNRRAAGSRQRAFGAAGVPCSSPSSRFGCRFSSQSTSPARVPWWTGGWAPAPNKRTIWWILAPVYLLQMSNFITLDLAPVVVPKLSLAVAALAALGAWRLRRAATVWVVLGCAALVLPVGLFLVSFVVPVMVPRYFALVRHRFLSLPAPGSGCRGCALPHWPQPSLDLPLQPDPLLPLRNQAALGPGGDRVCRHGAAGRRRHRRQLLRLFGAVLFCRRAGLDEHRVALTWQPPDPAAITPGHNLWVVYGRTGQAAKRQSAEQFLDTLAALGHPVVEHSVGRYIVLWRFNSARPPSNAAATAPRGFRRRRAAAVSIECRRLIGGDGAVRGADPPAAARCRLDLPTRLRQSRCSPANAETAMTVATDPKPFRHHLKREAAEARAYSQAVVTTGGRTVWLAGQVAPADGAGKSLAGDLTVRFARSSRVSGEPCPSSAAASPTWSR